MQATNSQQKFKLYVYQSMSSLKAVLRETPALEELKVLSRFCKPDWAARERGARTRLGLGYRDK